MLFTTTFHGHVQRSVRGKAPNALRLVRQRVRPDELPLYRRARAHQALYAAAARLWAEGVPMQKALRIVAQAIKATT